MNVVHGLDDIGETVSSPQFFFAQDRSVADEAFAGDVVGIPNHGTLRIGDTLTEGEDLTFVGVPSFAPEIVRRVRLTDAMKAKKLKEALQQMSEEGVVQVFRPRDGALHGQLQGTAADHGHDDLDGHPRARSPADHADRGRARLTGPLSSPARSRA